MGNEIPEELVEVRNKIDTLNSQLIKLLTDRSELVSDVARIKTEYKLPPLQPERYQSMLDGLLAQAKELGLDEQLVSEVFDAIHHSALRQEVKIIGNHE